MSTQTQLPLASPERSESGSESGSIAQLRAEALDAELAVLSRRLKRETYPERSGLDQARSAQRGVLEFVDDLFNQRGFSFLFASDLDEVGRLLKDALQTALILLPSEGLHFEDPRWNAIRHEVESLKDSLDYVLESRTAEVAAEIACEAVTYQEVQAASLRSCMEAA
tara:strand:+ start:2751 stop:3251 length:501 start_codon:yes stop_codon:yes gene_type:complete